MSISKLKRELKELNKDYNSLSHEQRAKATWIRRNIVAKTKELRELLKDESKIEPEQDRQIGSFPVIPFFKRL